MQIDLQMALNIPDCNMGKSLKKRDFKQPPKYKTSNYLIQDIHYQAPQ